MIRIIACFFALALCAFPAYAATEACPDLTLIQRWAGYLSWMGLLKALGVVAIAIGIIFVCWGAITWLLGNLFLALREVLDVVAHLVSFSLIALGSQVSEAYRLWPVLIGCLLFAGSTMLTIALRKIKGDNPTGLFSLFAVVWGAVALYYNMPEVGFIAVLAVMGALRFSFVVMSCGYAFGFEKDSIALATTSAFTMLVVYMLMHIFGPGSLTYLSVFSAGVFWASSFVMYLGLLILALDRYQRAVSGTAYAVMQVLMVVACLAGVALGMTFGINPLAGIAGTFGVLYVASKIAEVPTSGLIALGMKMLVFGAFLSGAWYVGMQNEALVKTYLTTQLPA
jgi:hypothetical protein